MSETEQQPATRPLKRRRFQYSLRSLFVLIGATAVFFSVAHTLGYADAVVILAAFVVLVGVVKYPRRVHPATGILLALVAGTLLWANLRPTGWQREFNEMPPDQLDPVTKSMFYRGWPLSPFMVCPIYFMKFQPGDGAVHGALVLDGVLFAVVLLVVRGVCELCFRRRRGGADERA
jgi:hypothetical protein